MSFETEAALQRDRTSRENNWLAIVAIIAMVAGACGVLS